VLFFNEKYIKKVGGGGGGGGGKCVLTMRMSEMTRKIASVSTILQLLVATPICLEL